jgi:threonine aldolase
VNIWYELTGSAGWGLGRDIAAAADTVMFCVSKGLSAPIGSLLCGSAEFVERARRTRQMVGGGTRQMGIIAAAGIVALDRMIDRLQEDHDNGRALAEGIAEIPGVDVDLSLVQTNLVWFNVLDASMSEPEFADLLVKEGILMLAMGPRRLRAVTHYGIERKDVEDTLLIMRRVMAGSHT